MSDIYQKLTKNKRFELCLRVLTVLVLLWLFLIGVKTLSGGLKLLGEGFAQTLFDVTSNPVVSLMAGALATVLFQSSSVTTSIVVGLVGAGTLSISGAVPMIMGANIGTSVTNSLVSLAYIRDKQNFKRAFAAATVHDFFNFLTVLVLLPLEIMTGFIEKAATMVAGLLYGSAMGLSFSSPIKMIIKPAANFIKSQSLGYFPDWAGLFMIVLAGTFIIVSLTLIVRVMSHLVESQEGRLIENVFSKNSYAALFFGIVATIAAQSSSITTSLLIPLAGSGLLSLQAIYPVTVGANLGTTATALLAAMTGNMAGLAIALVHLFFNIIGTMLFFMTPGLRVLPIRCATILAESIEKTKAYGFCYVGMVFFLLPLSMIYFVR